MFFTKIAMFGALAFQTAPAQLPDLARWNEVSPPGAPFRIDIPMQLAPQPDRVIGTTTIKKWSTNYGLMGVELGFTDRTLKASFSARDNLEQLAGGLLKQWAGATAKVTDLNILGYPAAKMEITRPLDSGRTIRTERLLIRVGDDDWTVQTTRFIDGGDAIDSAHIFASIRAPSPPPPPPISTSIGRMTISAFGKPVVTPDKLDAASPYEKWVTYAFEYQGSTKAWIYNIRVKPGNVFDARGMAGMLVDTVVNQSNPRPSIAIFPMRVGGKQGEFARGQAITGDGKECFRILAIGDGQEGWAMLLAGPNYARTETMLRNMIDSIRFAP